MRLVLLNIILLLILLGVFISGYPIFRYPEEFHWQQTLQEVEWKYAGMGILGAYTLSYLLSLIIYKKRSFVKKFLTILPIILVTGMLILGNYIFSIYLINKMEYDRLVNYYEEKAKKDLKNGLIIYEYEGGFELPFATDKNEQKKSVLIARLRKSYGIKYKNMGVIIGPAAIKAQEVYKKHTQPFLDQRNGPGWEERLKREEEAIEQGTYAPS